ncbi:hypothetical protein [Vibrio harveyi]|uniref:hypothetical protein n=1 Tax=Vibrio harveyi TaxID=669 RepID=UPI003CF49725
MKSRKFKKTLLIPMLAGLVISACLGQYLFRSDNDPHRLAMTYLNQAQLILAGVTLYKLDHGKYPPYLTDLLVDGKYLKEIPLLPVDSRFILNDWSILESDEHNLYIGTRILLSHDHEFGITAEICNQINLIASKNGYGCQTLKSKEDFNGEITDNNYQMHPQAVVFVTPL